MTSFIIKFYYKILKHVTKYEILHKEFWFTYNIR